MKTKAIRFFKEQTGLTLSQAKKQIKSQMTVRYGNTESGDIETSNVRLFYSANPNYRSGGKDGGIGFFLAVRLPNMGFTKYYKV